jgi:hypothetical protein
MYCIPYSPLYVQHMSHNYIYCLPWLRLYSHKMKISHSIFMSLLHCSVTAHAGSLFKMCTVHSHNNYRLRKWLSHTVMNADNLEIRLHRLLFCQVIFFIHHLLCLTMYNYWLFWHPASCSVYLFKTTFQRLDSVSFLR